jgi:phage terminase large subunit
MENIINLLPKQTVAFNHYEDPNILELGYGGAAGGGKTRLGVYLAIYIAEKYAGSRALIGRKELKVLRLTTIASLFETLAEYKYIKDRDYVYHAQDSKLSFSNGSEILFVDTAYSPQDPEYTRFGSYEITWAWIDESNETPLKAKQILKTRVGRKNKLNGIEIKPFWLETFNPDKGHVYTDYYKPFKSGTMPPYRAFVRALPADNPHLPNAYIENLKRADKITRERLLEGNFDYDSDDNALIRYDYIEDLWTNILDKTDRKFITCDVARYGGDKTIITVWDDFEVVDIGMFNGLGVDMVAEKVREYSVKYKIPYSHILIDEDGVGGGVVDILRGVKGFMANRTPFPNRITGKPDNFANLKTQCCYYLADWINAHKMAIKIDDENMKENIRQDLSWIKRKDADKDGKLYVISKDEIKEAIGRSPDIGDTLMMRMYFELQSPTPPQMTSDPILTLLSRRMNQTPDGGNQLNYN